MWWSSGRLCYHPANCFSTVTPLHMHEFTLYSSFFSLDFSVFVLFQLFLSWCCLILWIPECFVVFLALADVTARTKRNRSRRKNWKVPKDTRVEHTGAFARTSVPDRASLLGHFWEMCFHRCVLPAVVTHVYPPLLWIRPLLQRRVPVSKTRCGRDSCTHARAVADGRAFHQGVRDGQERQLFIQRK